MSSTSNTYSTAGSIITYSISSIFITLLIWGNIRVFKLRYASFVRRRSQSVYWGLNISYIISIIAILNVRRNLIQTMKDEINHNNNTLGFTFTSIALCVIMLCFWLLLFLLNMRSWLLWFQNEYNYYQCKLEWQTIINPISTHHRKNSNWYLLNKNKFGRIGFVSKLFGFIHLFLCLLSCFGILLKFVYIHNILMVQNNDNDDPLIKMYSYLTSLLISLVFILAVLFNIVITYKIPSYVHDPFYIYWECKIHLKLIIIFLILSVFTNFAYFQFNDIITYEALIDIITWIASSISFIMGYISTFYLIKISTKKLLPKPPSIKSSNSGVLKKTRSHTMDMLQQYTSQSVNLEYILSDKQALNLFMQHIAKEISMECLLSYIEFTQYQQRLLQKLKNEPDTKFFKTPITTDNITDEIPISSIVSNVPINTSSAGYYDDLRGSVLLELEMDCDLNSDSKEKTKSDSDLFLFHAKIAAFELYNKYIKTSSKFEINIPWDIRTVIEGKLGNKQKLMNDTECDIRALIIIFENAKNEMYQLLNFSLARFKSTDEFHVIMQLIAKNSPSSATDRDIHLEISTIQQGQ